MSGKVNADYAQNGLDIPCGGCTYSVMKLSPFEQERLDFIVTDYKLGPALKKSFQDLVESVKQQAHTSGFDEGRNFATRMHGR